MSEKLYPVTAEWKAAAHIDEAKYNAMYKSATDTPDVFWGEQGKRIDWFKPYTQVKNTSFDSHNVSIKWFEDGLTNVAYNCIDRHLATRGDQIALLDRIVRRAQRLGEAGCLKTDVAFQRFGTTLVESAFDVAAHRRKADAELSRDRLALVSRDQQVQNHLAPCDFPCAALPRCGAFAGAVRHFRVGRVHG